METKEFKITEVRAEMKADFTNSLLANYPELVQVDTNEYVMPVDTVAGTQYVGITITAKDTVGNKRNPGFVLADAVQKYADKLAAKVEAAEAKAAEKAAKAAEKATAKA